MNLRNNLIGGLLLMAMTVPLWTAEAAEIMDKETSKPIMTEAVWTKPEIKSSIEGVLSPYFTGEKVIKHKKDKGPKIKDIPYVIVDLDEAAGVNQAQESIALYQVTRLAFAIPPEHMRAVLQTGMTREQLHKTWGADNGEGRPLLLSSVIDDVVSAYTKLYEEKLVTSTGMEIKKDKRTAEYYDFVTKMMWLYHAINATQGIEVAKPWAGYWLTGMTPFEAYDLSIHGVELYGDYEEELTPEEKKKKAKKKAEKPVVERVVTLTSRVVEGNKTGMASVKCYQGITSSKQVAQLVKAAQASGLDVWFVSSANYETTRATMNYYHVPAPDGILALRYNVNKSGKYVNQYNAKYHPAPVGQGKLEAVKENITGYYNTKNPAILAVDSTDDSLKNAYPESKLIVTFDRLGAVSAVEGFDKEAEKAKKKAEKQAKKAKKNEQADEVVALEDEQDSSTSDVKEVDENEQQ